MSNVNREKGYFTASERLSSHGTGTSYARIDNATWPHLAFSAVDETKLAIAKFKTRIFRRDTAF